MPDHPVLFPEARTWADLFEPGERPFLLHRGEQGSRYHFDALYDFVACEVKPKPRYLRARLRSEVASLASAYVVVDHHRDYLTPRVIEWEDGRALVVANHHVISGGVWLAFIDPATIPGGAE